jgi:hypothetical protein
MRIVILAVLAAIGLSGPAIAQISLAKARDCLLIEAQSKERLDCFDSLSAPQPRANIVARTIVQCRHVIEEDERLACYERFVTPRLSPDPRPRQAATPSPAPPVSSPTRAMTLAKPIVSSGSCSCSSGRVCVGPRGGRYCITSGGNKRYLPR